MKLNHLNLCVADVAATTTFFETFFNFKCTAKKGDNVLAVLEGEDNFVLVLSNLQKETTITYPKDFHIGFMLKDEAAVNAQFNKLKAGGITLPSEPRKIRDTISFYFIAPGDFMVEVGCPAF